MKALILLFLFQALFAWDKVVEISNNTDGDVDRSAMYLDGGTFTTHYFWCQVNIFTGKYRLMYRSQNINGNLFPIKVLDMEHDCILPTAAGENNGKNIYVAFNAHRVTRGSAKCDEDNLPSCQEIYILETKDGGNTWTKPMPIKRANMNDVVNRWSPSIIVHPDTKRIWITYINKNYIGLRFTIGYVTRPRGSSLYSNEALLDNREGAIVFTTVAISNFNSVQMVHIIWTAETNNILRIYQRITKTNGIKWSAPQYISDGHINDAYSDIEIGGFSIYVPYTPIENNYMCIKMSNNAGRDWHNTPIMQGKGFGKLAGCVKKAQKEVRLFAIANLRSDKYTTYFGWMNPINSKWNQEKTPFDGIDTRLEPSVECAVRGSKIVVKILTAKRGSGIISATNEYS